MKKEKILVIGGAGYIGSSLVTELVRKNYYVLVIDNLLYSTDSLSHLFKYKNFDLLVADILKINNLKKIISKFDIIIPLAALVGAPLCDKYPKKAKILNYNFIKKISKLIRNKKKIIFLNTNSGYGIGDKAVFCNEESKLNPISLYGLTKVNAEKEIVKNSKNWVVLRLATVFGYSYRMRTDLLVNNLVYRAVKYKKIDLYEPEFRRNFIHISDVVKAIIFTIENFSKVNKNIFNLGLSSANLTKKELVEKIRKFLPQVKIYIVKNNTDPDKRDYFVCNSKIEKIGFKADFSLENGIKELKKVFLNNTEKIFINNY
jgi:nucleoside-diphosphate-sugar epimerase